MAYLARQFQKGGAYQTPLNQRIDAVKADINLQAVILLDEFFLKAVRPQVDQKTHFSGVFNNFGVFAYARIDSMTRDPNYQTAFLSHDQLTPAMRRFYKLRCVEQDVHWRTDMPVDWNRVWPFGDKINVPGNAQNLLRRMRDAFLMEPAPQERTYPTAVLGDVLWLLNVRGKMSVGKMSVISDFQFHEKTAQLLGQGQSVLDFWEDVKGLKDYAPDLAPSYKAARRDYRVMDQCFNVKRLIDFGWPGFDPNPV